MRTLSLLQPWAQLVVIGAKEIETRSWPTAYRGPLLIHASKNFPKWARQFSVTPQCYETFRVYNKTPNPGPYPTGAILGRVDLVDCTRTEDLLQAGISHREQYLGDYSPGRWGWILRKPEEFSDPISARGSLGLWEFPESALGHLAREP